MSWVAEVHSKAQILLSQVANARRLAERSGVDGDALCRELYRQVSLIYETEFPLAKAMDESDLVFHLQGPALRDQTPKLKLIESVFSNIRQQVLSVAKAVANLGANQALMEQDVDLSLSGLAPGSLYVGVKAEAAERPDGQQLLFRDEEVLRATREAMRSIRVISRHLDDTSPEVRAEIPDARVRDAAFVAVARLAPTERSGITSLTITSTLHGGSSGADVGTALTPKLRKELRHQLKQDKPKDPHQFSLRGEVRELDLDFQRFELRRLQTLQDPAASVRCLLTADAKIDLEQLAGRRIEVTGFGEDSPTGIPRMLRVVRVVFLGDDGLAKPEPDIFGNSAPRHE
jgi:hypothetical protein